MTTEPRKPGRKPSGLGPQTNIAFMPDMLAAIDREADRQGVTRSEWIRQACQQVLDTTNERDHMSTEWTAERLDALTVDTVIGFTDADSGNPRRTTRYPDGFDLTLLCEGFPGAAVLEAAEPGSIHVISVPIAALLSEGTVIASSWFIRDPAAREIVRNALHASIGYVTGDPI